MLYYLVLYSNKIIPEQYLSHFIRGYFDGDGYVNYKKYTVTFVGGSERFMRSLEKLLINRGFTPQFVTQNNNYRLHIRGRKSIKLFSEWIYLNKGIYLKRKFETFNKETLGVEELHDSIHANSIIAVKKRKINFLMIYTITKSIGDTCECLNIKAATFRRWIITDDLFKYNFNKIEEDNFL